MSGTLIDTNPGVATYQNMQNCSWTITAPAGQQVTLTFLTFNTEMFYDYFTVYNGSPLSSSLLMRVSGATVPAVVTS